MVFKADICLKRRLPWESTLQVSLTLALVNPVLWYLVDRSKVGFVLSAIVGIGGTAICLNVNPQAPTYPNATSAPYHHDGKMSLVSTEGIGVGTWIASVLFCSSVCFGNIGRRLAMGRRGQKD